MSAATRGEGEDADSLVKMDLIRRQKLKSPTKMESDWWAVMLLHPPNSVSHPPAPTNPRFRSSRHTSGSLVPSKLGVPGFIHPDITD